MKKPDENKDNQNKTGWMAIVQVPFDNNRGNKQHVLICCLSDSKPDI